MHQLEPSQFSRARWLIPSPRDAGHLAFAHALLDGTIPGRVFVDDRWDPRSALFCAENGFFLAAGLAHRELASHAIAALQGLWTTQLQESRLVIATNDGWAATLRMLLPAEERRIEFHHNGIRPVLPRLPRGYRLEPLTEASAAAFGSGIDPWVVRTMGGPASFASRSFGAVVLSDDGSLASACVACAIGGGEAEIEIGTDPRHRRRGLATVAGAAFVAECAARNLVPAWTCDAANEPSIRCAARLGFTSFRVVTVFPLGSLLVRAGEGWQLADRLRS